MVSGCDSYGPIMKFRTGLVIGFGLGYYFGAKAGRERYIQIERFLDKARGTPRYLDVRSKLDELSAQGRLRTRGLLDDATGGAASTLLDLRSDSLAEHDDVLDEPTA
jgi:hypothetical protein